MRHQVYRLVRAAAAAFVVLLAALAAAAAEPAAPAAPAPGDRLTLPAGTALLPLASRVAPPLATLPEPAEVVVLEASERWLRVAWGETTGWVDLGSAPTAAAGEPAPQAAEPDLLTVAREVLGDDARTRSIGPFALHTDVAAHGASAELVARLDGLATRVVETYTARYGLPVPGTPEGAGVPPADLGSVVLFADAADFRRLMRRLAASGSAAGDAAEEGAAKEADGAGDAGGDFAGQTLGRLAALHADGRGRAQVARILVHELVHLLNRRALGEHGAPLPPWLDEGLAGDFDLFTYGADGGLDDGEPTRFSIEFHGRPRPYGPLIALPRIAGDADRGRLEGLAALAALDRAEFLQAPRRAERYALAAFWVRYLLRGEGGAQAAPFRGWLLVAAASGGAAVDAGDLLARIAAATGRGPEAVDAGFRRWLVDLTFRLGLEPAPR